MTPAGSRSLAEDPVDVRLARPRVADGPRAGVAFGFARPTVNVGLDRPGGLDR